MGLAYGDWAAPRRLHEIQFGGIKVRLGVKGLGLLRRGLIKLRSLLYRVRSIGIFICRDRNL